MKLTCPHCGKIVIVSDKFSGDEDICPHCYKKFDLQREVLKWKTAFKQKSDTDDRNKPE